MLHDDLSAFLTLFGLLLSAIWVQAVPMVDNRIPWSELSRFVVNFDTFFASKCNFNADIRRQDWRDEWKECMERMRAEEVQRYFRMMEEQQVDTDQNQKMDQNQNNASQNQNLDLNQNSTSQTQNPDQNVPLTARTLMNLMLRQMLFALLKDRTLSRFEKMLNEPHPLIIAEFINEQELAKLAPKQNLMIFSQLFHKMWVFTRALEEEFGGENKRKLAQLGDKSSLIRMEWYGKMHAKYMKVEELVDEILRQKYNWDFMWFSSTVHSDFRINPEWMDQHEHIDGWKLDQY